MQVLRHEPIQWEPLCLRLRCERAAERVEGVVQSLASFVTERAAVGWCRCDDKFQDVRGERDSGEVIVLFQWVCDVCLEQLVRRLTVDIAGLERIDIGNAIVGEAIESGTIRVAPKRVEFEDGSEALVGGFEIAKRAVTVGQMAAFCRDSGYKTTAETRGSESIFSANGELWAFPQNAHAGMTATYLSYLDACAYCEWGSYRLPTEAEWLAAAIIDETVYDIHADREKLLLPDGRWRLSQHPGALIGECYEWTASENEAGRAVLRRGPMLARTGQWRKHLSANRLLEDVAFFDALSAFRTCAAVP